MFFTWNDAEAAQVPDPLLKDGAFPLNDLDSTQNQPFGSAEAEGFLPCQQIFGGVTEE